MRSATESEVRDHLHEYLNDPEAEPVVIVSDGEPAGVLIPLAPGEDADSLTLSLSPEFRRLLESSHAQIQSGDHLSADGFWAEVDSAQ